MLSEGGKGTTDRPKEDGLSERKGPWEYSPARKSHTSLHQAWLTAPPGVDNSPPWCITRTLAHSATLIAKSTTPPEQSSAPGGERKLIKIGWFPWCYRLGRVRRGSGIWTHMSVFPSAGRLQSQSLLCSSVGKPMVRSLVEAGCSDLCSWLSLVRCQGQPAPAFSFQTISPLPTRSRISLSPFHPLPWAKHVHSSTQFKM